jgi:MFS transporter, NNP family, nitrate/nitrite transporter
MPNESQPNFTDRAKWRVLIISSTAFTLLFAVWLMFGMLMLKIAPELKLTVDQKAWCLATAILTGSILRLNFGIWADKYGGRLLMTGLLLFTALPTYFVSRVETYEHLLMCAALFGIAGNSFSVGISWNSAWFDNKTKGTALGIFGAGNVGASLTKFLSPWLLPLLPAAGLLGGIIPGGWRCIPVVYSVLLVIMAAVVWFGCPRPDRKPGKGRPLSEMLQPLKYVRVWRFSLYYVVVFGAYLALASWLPSFYKKNFNLSDETSGYLTALYIFPASLLRPYGGYLSDKFGPRRVTYGVYIAMTLALSAICFSPRLETLGLYGFTTLIVVVGCAMGIGKASIFKYIPNYFPRDVGAVGGMVGMLGALGMPPAFEKFIGWTGQPQMAFLPVLALTVISLVWLHLVVLQLKAASRPSTTIAASEAPAQTLTAPLVS